MASFWIGNFNNVQIHLEQVFWGYDTQTHKALNKSKFVRKHTYFAQFVVSILNLMSHSLTHAKLKRSEGSSIAHTILPLNPSAVGALIVPVSHGSFYRSGTQQ